MEKGEIPIQWSPDNAMLYVYRPTALPAQVYRVKRGDTLFSIAQLFDTTVAKIKSWNGLRGNIISPGTRLKIFASRAR